MTTELLADRALVLQVHRVLTEIDPVRWRDDAAAALKARLTELQRKLEQRERLAELAGALRNNLPQLEQPTPDVRARWLAFKKSLQPAYESIATSLRAEKIHVPSLRPTNWARSLFHVAAAAFAIVLIEVMPTPLALTLMALSYAATCWSLELARRVSPKMNQALMKFFSRVAHAHEATRVNSSTWYATALVLLTLTRSPIICLAAVGVLGIGDPVAALIGRRFGRIRLLHGRTLEGSLAFFFSGALVAFGLLAVLHSELTLLAALAISACGALFGAIAEVFSLRVDDNLAVPLGAALGAGLALFLI